MTRSSRTSRLLPVALVAFVVIFSSSSTIWTSTTVSEGLDHVLLEQMDLPAIVSDLLPSATVYEGNVKVEQQQQRPEQHDERSHDPPQQPKRPEQLDDNANQPQSAPLPNVSEELPRAALEQTGENSHQTDMNLKLNDSQESTLHEPKPDSDGEDPIQKDADSEIMKDPLAKSENETDNARDAEEPESEMFWGSPLSTLVSFGDCECQLVSIDCLDTVKCLQTGSLDRVYMGVVTRRVLKHFAVVDDKFDFEGDLPLGKMMQFVSLSMWETWISKNSISYGFQSDTPDAFINHTLYPFCRENGLVGRSCFFNDFLGLEEYGNLELEAISKFEPIAKPHEMNETKHKLETFRHDPFNATTFDYLLTFAHVSRITTNIRAHLHEVYANHTITIDHGIRDHVIRVSMHVRRGDACQHKTTGYQKRASPIDSRAQVGATRMCYETSVYINAVQRVVSLVPDRHVIVHVSTDHSRSLMDEIKRDFADFYNSVSWRYVEYPRDIFDYFGGKGSDSSYIESPDNKFRDVLGETAIVDMWHLSHGEVFVGHLGSRFGKLGWFQATARYNSFIPFFSVDGHSVCCDIDEACGANAEFIVSMENCMGKFWANSVYTNDIDPEIYFSSGAYFRKAAAVDEMKFRREHGIRSVSLS